MALLRLTCVLALLGVLSSLSLADAEPLQVEAEVDRRDIAVGDTFSLDLHLDWEEGVEVKPVAVGDMIGSFVVRDISRGLATRVGDRFKRTVSLLLTVFETGPQTIPSIPVVFIDQDGSVGKMETSSIDIVVETILPEGAGGIRDIKAPLAVPKRWKDLFLSYLLVFGLIAGTALSVLFSVKRKHEIDALLRRVWHRIAGPLRYLILRLLALIRVARTGKQERLTFDVRVDEPDLMPEEAALKELERIAALGLIERGRIKDHYTLVSEVVRRYLERKYNVLAMESPISYTLSELSECDVSSAGYALIEEILREGDLVKFAKHTPLAEMVDSLLDRARRIVYVTGTQGVGVQTAGLGAR